MLRRRLNDDIKYAPYISGKAQKQTGGTEDNELAFMVEIPINWPRQAKSLTYRWANSGTLGTVVGSGLAAIYLKNDQGQRVDYFAGTSETGERTSSVNAATAESSKTLVFTGYLQDIANCYVKDETNNVYLWRYTT